MNKSELITSLSDSQNITHDEAATVLDFFIDIIKATLVDGNRIEIRGFGSFQMKDYKGYTGRNPRSGEKATVAPKRLPVFRPGKELKDFLNSK